MKTFLSLSMALSFLGVAASAQAENLVLQYGSLNIDIPDANDSGVADTRTLSGITGAITDINITLQISGRDGGAFNGDLYVGLLHESGYAVLLNRVGRDTGNAFGYSDNGFNVTLDDQAANGDIHIYRATLGGSPAGALTGLWAPDGRLQDPGLVVSGSSRDAMLGVFTQLDPNGDWTLFVADMESGGLSRLDGWGMEVTTVPEPSTYGFAALGMITLLGVRQWRKK